MLDQTATRKGRPIWAQSTVAKITVAPVQKADFPVYLTGLGTVQGFNTVQVRTRVDGQIDKIAFTEPEAAAILSLRPHVLRDARLRGEISGSRVGKRILYERTELLRFLHQQRHVLDVLILEAMPPSTSACPEMWLGASAL